tara:strand:+ start:5645 stop:6175 length:531 start_codon:yes stop_codon:yes gene_type:complete
MYLKSLQGSRLVIGLYPPFEYDAQGGGGKAKILTNKKDNILNLIFESNKFSIPPLITKTTKFLYCPLPPGLKIDMNMEKLEGTLDQDSGTVILKFESQFIFSILSIFYFPALLIKTTLTTRKVKGTLQEAEGKVLNSNGEVTLVGIATVQKTGNKILDTLLMLPNEALAVLKCEIK